MTIDLLLVFLLEAEYNLCRNYTFIWVFKVKIGVQAKRRGVFEKMSCHVVPVYLSFHVTRVRGLIYPQKREAVEDAGVNLSTTVSNDAYYDLHNTGVSAR